MLPGRIKSSIESISSLKILGVKHYVLVDLFERYASIALIQRNDSQLRLIYNKRNPAFKLLELRELDLDYDNNLLKREIDRLIENYRIDKAVQVLIVNKYKYLDIRISRESLEDNDEASIDGLLRKQLPENLNENEFIINYKKISADESFENYIVTIIRKQEFEKYNDILTNDSFYLKFAVPFIYPFAFQADTQQKLTNLVDFHKQRITHFHAGKENKIFEDEYYPAEDSQIEIEKIFQSIEENSVNRSNNEPDQHNKIFINTRLELNQLLNSLMMNIRNSDSALTDYKYDRIYKHSLVYNFLFNDSIFNFRYSHYPSGSLMPDLEKTIITRIVIAAFGVLLFLLLLLNSLNLLADNSLSEIASMHDDRRKIELTIKNLADRNEQVKSDILSLKQVKYSSDKVSSLLKILSINSVDNSKLTDVQLVKSNSGKYQVKLNGESESKDEVVNLIRNLEKAGNFSDIELVWLDKKSVSAIRSKTNNSSYIFSISLIYNEDRKPQI